MLRLKPEVSGMSRLSIVLLIVTGLAATAYFGAAAWRLTGDGHLDITGQISPPAR
jgi:type 1 fimbria pilin